LSESHKPLRRRLLQEGNVPLEGGERFGERSSKGPVDLLVRGIALGEAEQPRAPGKEVGVGRVVAPVENVPREHPHAGSKRHHTLWETSMEEDTREREHEVPEAAPEEHAPGVLGRTLKRAAAALRDAEVSFLLCGSMACWARGGPPLVTKDVDFCVKADDAEQALRALADAGMPIERPPEGWLYKAWDDDILIDLLFCPAGVPVTDEILGRGDELTVMSVPMRVAAIDDVMSTKLLALNEHSLDLEQLLQVARSLREAIDWEEVRSRTEDSPYARAFFTLVEALAIAAPRDSGPTRGIRSATFSAAAKARRESRR
jgi:hypothetical protein